VKRTHAYLPATRRALEALGAQVGVARRELGWTAAELAERLGVNPQLIGRIEKGAPGTAIGTVFEAAILCGVPLYGVEASGLDEVAHRERDRLALLPARVRSRAPEVDDDF
jgi:transcriptional regulator with XRE-family HTH domain